MTIATAGREATKPNEARPGARANESRQLQLVTFGVETEEYAVDILSVQEINRMLPITRVPQSPSCVEGVINLRGRIIPIIDMRKRFRLPAKNATGESRIIVAEVENRVLGFIVDRVNEVLRIDRSIVDPTPDMVAGVDSEYIEGVGKLEDRIIILVNLQKLFNLKHIEEMDRVAAAPEGSASAQLSED